MRVKINKDACVVCHKDLKLCYCCDHINNSRYSYIFFVIIKYVCNDSNCMIDNNTYVLCLFPIRIRSLRATYFAYTTT